MKIRFNIENEVKFNKKTIMNWVSDLKIEDIKDDETCDFYIWVNSIDELFNIIADIDNEIVLDIICDEYFIKLK